MRAVQVPIAQLEQPIIQVEQLLKTVVVFTAIAITVVVAVAMVMVMASAPAKTTPTSFVAALITT